MIIDGSAPDLETLAALLAESGEYRVLRRLKSGACLHEADGSETRVGLFVDVETTGLDPARDEIIELAMVPFTYALDGRIFAIGEPFHSLREPSCPIPPEVTRLTGLDDQVVKGHAITPTTVSAFAAPAALVIAHNAAFDRRFLERFCDVFTNKAWACSMSQVDWQNEGFEGTKLAYLVSGAGCFYDRHRALNDCLAAIEILGTPLPRSGQTALAQLLERARRRAVRIWAENSPYDLRHLLRARGYRWNAEGNAAPKAWFIDVDEEDREAEITFLRKEIYRREVDLFTTRLTPYDRFSDRV